jgi:hypothetical protein
VGTSSPEDKLAGDLGNVIEATSIGGRRSDFFTARKLAPGNLGLCNKICQKRKSIAAGFERQFRTTLDMLEPQIRQPGVLSWAGTGPIPEVFPVGFLDRKVVDAGISVVHQAIGPEMPILVPVRTEPVSGVIVPLVSEAHRDAVAGKGPIVPL